MKLQYRYLTQFDFNSGVTESTATYQTLTPSLQFIQNTYCIKNLESLVNYGSTFNIRFQTIHPTAARFMIAATADGAGYALDFVSVSSTSTMLRVVTTDGWTSASTSTLDEFDINKKAFGLVTTKYYACKTVLVDDTVDVFFNGSLFLTVPSLDLTGKTYTGWASLNVTNSTWNVSDYWIYLNQIFNGTVRFNSTNEFPKMNVYRFRQTGGTSLISGEKKMADSNGKYRFLATEDPAVNYNWLLYANYTDRPDVCPRGICNLSLPQ